MASQPIRAIFQNGSLHLLDPVELTEGEEVQVTILSERERLRAALGNLLVPIAEVDDDVDEEALMREVEEGFRGKPPLSETIIQERNEGP